MQYVYNGHEYTAETLGTLDALFAGYDTWHKDALGCSPPWNRPVKRLERRLKSELMFVDGFAAPPTYYHKPPPIYSPDHPIYAALMQIWPALEKLAAAHDLALWPVNYGHCIQVYFSTQFGVWREPVTVRQDDIVAAGFIHLGPPRVENALARLEDALPNCAELKWRARKLQRRAVKAELRTLLQREGRLGELTGELLNMWRQIETLVAQIGAQTGAPTTDAGLIADLKTILMHTTLRPGGEGTQATAEHFDKLQL